MIMVGFICMGAIALFLIFVWNLFMDVFIPLNGPYDKD